MQNAVCPAPAWLKVKYQGHKLNISHTQQMH